MPLPPLASPYGTTFSPQGNLGPVPTRIADMGFMGVKNVRLFVDWANIETAPGVYHFETIMDPIIGLFNAAGIAVTYCLSAAPAWHTDSTICPGKNFMIPADAAAFLSIVAHRYTLGDPTNPGSLFIVGVEGANEEFSSGAQQCRIGPYAANHMKAVYAAVKAVNPNLVVGGPAITGLQQAYFLEWYAAFYSNGGLSDYDHNHFYTQRYPSATPDTGTMNFAQCFQAIAAVQAAYGHAGKKIRCTEAGIAVPGPNNTNTSQIQSDWYIDALDTARHLNAATSGQFEMVELFTIGAGGFSPVSGVSHETFGTLYFAHHNYTQLHPSWPGDASTYTAFRSGKNSNVVRSGKQAAAIRSGKNSFAVRES